jgi:outer membrane protein OmpA-like peptidoglycan-associated protein
MKRLFLLFLYSAVLLAFTTVHAQPTASFSATASNRLESAERDITSYLGGYVAGNFMLHNANFNAIVACPTCNPYPAFGAQLGFGGVAGLMYEYPFSPTFRLQARLGATYWAGNFLVDEPQRFVQQGQTDFIEGTFRHTLTSSMLAVSFEPAVSIRLFEGLRAELGGSIGGAATSAFQQRETIVGGRYVRPDGSQSSVWVDTSGSLGSFATLGSRLQLAAFAGVSWQFPLGETTFLAPFARFYFPFTTLAPTESIRAASVREPRQVVAGTWQAMTLQAGLALTFGIERRKPTDTKYLRDTTVVFVDGMDENLRLVSSEASAEKIQDYGLEVERTTVREKYVREVPKRNALHLDLKVVGIGRDGDEQENPTVVVEEFESEDFKPLLPYIYFPEGSDSLKLTRQHLLQNPRSADRWTERDVSDEPLGVFADLLNVIALRMKKNPAATLTLTGCNANYGAELGDTLLSRRRAENIERYLSKVWGIPPSRITTRAQNLPTRPARQDTEDGRAENRRVEIEASQPEILAPFVDENIAVEITPPTLELTPIIEAPAGLNWWYMYVKQRSNLLKQFSGAEPVRQQWQISKNLLAPGQDLPLAITLQAADQTNRQGTVSKDVTVKQITVKKKRQELLDDKRIDRFSFIMFDYDKSVIESESSKKLITQIKSKIAPSSTVIIAGYGDRSGARDYNRDLANRRCLEVQRLLQVPENQVKIKALGNAVQIHDNDLPEGRAYSRIVQLTIETPLKPGTPLKNTGQRKK